MWSPHVQKDFKKLEIIQRTAMKMVPEMKDLTYEERLKEMGLPTLYKMVSHMKKIDTQDLLSLTEGDR